MADTAPRLVRAWMDSPTSGVAEFDRNWAANQAPPLSLSGGAPSLVDIGPASDLAVALVYRYYLEAPDILCFVLPLTDSCEADPATDAVFVAGDFNGWQEAIGKPQWRLQPGILGGEEVLIWKGSPSGVLGGDPVRFKFVTAENFWLAPADDAPNTTRDEHGNVNRIADPRKTGRHLWKFSVSSPLDLAQGWSANVGPGAPSVPLGFGRFFYELASDLPMGALVSEQSTLFRIFAPRAVGVVVFACYDLSARKEALAFPLEPMRGTGLWEVEIDQNLHGWYYWYSIDGTRSGPGLFNPSVQVLDPYALATVGREGPGIIVDPKWIGSADPGFRTPAWHDLVIAEAHVRDLAAHAPVDASAEERRGFTGLKKWVESEDFHLHRLGVNCVELQPVQEFDNKTIEEYHWGYMTNNFFAPESSYSLLPDCGSGIRELQDLVGAFHRRGMAVLLDVVYNHVGEPAHLMALDRQYYFEQDAAGNLSNWSGCGNDLRARSAMSIRLIIDSCTHLIRAYGVDGFRFDLAELLSREVLRQVESALKRVKPDVILVAEPWSYRGHIAGALRETGWASWNDGYRMHLPDYVRGRASSERMEYFLRGSPWYFAKWPAQTVNYTESHDDRTWIDVITENPDFNGSSPAPSDVRRTHLMASLLFMSLGIPMIAAGQDFLRSKGGLTNTYQRGDVNALDYRRLLRHLGTHTYFAEWIAFRLGDRGRLLRHFTRPSEGFLKFFRSDGPPLAAVYNADLSQGPERLLYAVNPTLQEVTVAIGDTAESGNWRQIADHARFLNPGSSAATSPVEAQLYLPALGCGLWVASE